MRETGLAEGLDKLEAELDARARAVPAAWAAAAVTEQSDLVDAVAAVAPRRSGELVGSGFVNRETGEAGFGSDHAWRIEQQFDEMAAERADGAAARMAELLDGYVEAGVTPETAPCNWPNEPETHATTSAGVRERQSERVNAGAPRQRR